jgi:drug/metabolite transporter (DMT)-like permease
VFASALAFYVQTLAQRHIDPNRVALIFTLEPAWALVAAFVLAGQRFGLEQALGAALMLIAIVGHELASLKFKAHGQPPPP